jgi:DNA cross-link repair 1A protein
LDTTYCDSQYQFPPQAQIINQCIELIKNDVKRADTIILFGTYTIGKEKIFIEAALKYQCKIYVTTAKYKIIECLNYPPHIMRLFTKKLSEAKFHVVSLFEIGLDKITSYLKEQAWPVSRAVGIKPTGWNYSKSAQKPKKHMTKDETVTTWDLPYSEHSSFNELQAFVKHVNAKFIIPTVNNYSADATKEIIRQLSPI